MTTYCGECGTAAESNRFCRKCGASIASSTATAVIVQTTEEQSRHSVSTPRQPNECPVCRRSDQVQSVSTVIASGRSSTSGSALSVPLLGGEWATTHFASASTSQLAARLSPPAQPLSTVRNWIWLYLVILTAGFSVWAITSVFDPRHPAFGNFINAAISIAIVIAIAVAATLPALLLSYISAGIANRTTLAEPRQAWVPRAQRCLSAYYCFRDDQMFDEVTYGRPEDFIRTAFV